MFLFLFDTMNLAERGVVMNKKIVYIVMGIVCGILLLVLVPGIGASANGATRWIDLGFFQLQPSEFTKILLLLFFAKFLVLQLRRYN